MIFRLNRINYHLFMYGAIVAGLVLFPVLYMACAPAIEQRGWLTRRAPNLTRAERLRIDGIDCIVIEGWNATGVAVSCNWSEES